MRTIHSPPGYDGGFVQPSAQLLGLKLPGQAARRAGSDIRSMIILPSYSWSYSFGGRNFECVGATRGRSSTASRPFFLTSAASGRPTKISKPAISSNLVIWTPPTCPSGKSRGDTHCRLGRYPGTAAVSRVAQTNNRFILLTSDMRLTWAAEMRLRERPRRQGPPQGAAAKGLHLP